MCGQQSPEFGLQQENGIRNVDGVQAPENILRGNERELVVLGDY
jgi:hypothetical protein